MHLIANGNICTSPWFLDEFFQDNLVLLEIICRKYFLSIEHRFSAYHHVQVSVWHFSLRFFVKNHRRELCRPKHLFAVVLVPFESKITFSLDFPRDCAL